MSLLSRLTVTPLLYACGALLLLSIGLGIALNVQASKVDTANAQRDTANAQRDTVRTERDAWKVRVDELTTANAAFDNALTGLQGELQTCQGETVRITQAGQRAITAAQADARDADRTLQLFTAKFQQQSRQPDCARALQAMQDSCPALEDY